ncbi:MAG: threonine/serine exporter family protein [Dysgonamonadaceae bacterium]|jgi:uncharacterized membrane protein YjjB (DUF3815 family)|nr:threonine/serine exporter family protein [Dysgonamonadaceae bacterium]
MIFTDILMDGLPAAIAGVGFGAISHPPKRAFSYIAVLAAVGHAIRFALMNYLSLDIAFASFCAALSIGVLSLWFGRLSYCPMTVLYIPALLPMIPGMYAYRAVFALMMFMHSLHTPEVADTCMRMFFSNAIVAAGTIFLLAVGATIPTFLFPKRAYSITRK